MNEDDQELAEMVSEALRALSIAPNACSDDEIALVVQRLRQKSCTPSTLENHSRHSPIHPIAPPTLTPAGRFKQRTMPL